MYSESLHQLGAMGLDGLDAQVEVDRNFLGAELKALALDLDDFFDATEIVIVAGPDGIFAENPRIDTCSGPKS